MPLLRNLTVAPTRFRMPAVKAKPARVDRRGGDRGQGLVSGCAAITTGLVAKGHRAWIDAEFGRQVASALLDRPKGMKSRFTHPGLSADGLGRLLGRAKAPAGAASAEDLIDGRIVRADVHFAKSAHKTPKGDLAGYVMDVAEEDSDCFGLSIVFSRDSEAEESFRRQHLDDDGLFVSPDPENAHNRPHWRLLKLHAVDFVDEPAANEDGLFSAQDDLHLPEGAEIDAAWSFLLGRSDDDSLLEPMGLTSHIHPARLRQSFERFLERRQLRVMPEPAPEGDAMSEKEEPEEKAAKSEAAALERERKKLREERLAARKERAEARVERELAKLSSRLGLGAQDELRPLLETLFSVDDLPPTLNADGEETRLGDQVIAVIESLPDFSFRGGQLGGEDDENAQSPRDRRSKGDRARHQALGIEDERYQVLAERYDIQ